jgi:hypothetical protein
MVRSMRAKLHSVIEHTVDTWRRHVLETLERLLAAFIQELTTP